MAILSRVHAQNLVRWAQDKPEVLLLSADLTSSTEADLFQKTYPDRFLSFGVAEQNMVSWAGGLAREGFIPLIHTFAVFIYRRAYDQVAMSVAYPNLPVKFFGFLPGITTPGGATHQAIEDIALMSALPNMTVLECADATDVESVLEVAYAVNGPVYIRMLRGEIPRLFDPAIPMRLGQPRILSQGQDITLFSSGICTEEALRAIPVLQQRGVSIQHVQVSTLKPFNNTMAVAMAEQAKVGIITMENHVIRGGLGSCVAESLAEAGLGRRLVRIGLQDTFAHGGSRPYLMRTYGLDALALITQVETLMGERFHITPAELSTAYLAAVHSDAKAEAL
ncbi:Transketolase [Gammaproteobacteria bacterium]